MEMSLFGATDYVNHLDAGYAIDPTSLVLNPNGSAQSGTVNREIFQATSPDDSNVGYSGGALQPSFWSSLGQSIGNAIPGAVQNLTQQGTQLVQKYLPSGQTQQPVYVAPSSSGNTTLYLIVGFIALISLVMIVLIARK